MKHVFYLIFLVPFLALSAVVTIDLWDWFIFPLGAPKIGMAHALGISILIGWKTNTTRPDPDESLLDASVRMTTTTLMVWAFGFIFSVLM